MTWDGYPKDREVLAPHLLRDKHTRARVPAMWEPYEGFNGIWCFGRRLPRMGPETAVKNDLEYVGPYVPPPSPVA